MGYALAIPNIFFTNKFFFSVFFCAGVFRSRMNVSHVSAAPKQELCQFLKEM
jgi:hypothetical protein